MAGWGRERERGSSAFLMIALVRRERSLNPAMLPDRQTSRHRRTCTCSDGKMEGLADREKDRHTDTNYPGPPRYRDRPRILDAASQSTLTIRVGPDPAYTRTRLIPPSVESEEKPPPQWPHRLRVAGAAAARRPIALKELLLSAARVP